MKFSIFPKSNLPVKRGYYFAAIALLCVAIGLCITTSVIHSDVITALDNAPYSVDADIAFVKTTPTGDTTFTLNFINSYNEESIVRVTKSISKYPELANISAGSTVKIYYDYDADLQVDSASIFFDISASGYRTMIITTVACAILFLAYAVIVVLTKLRFNKYGYRGKAPSAKSK